LHKIIVNNRSVAPSKILCVGRNYYAHIEELDNPVPEHMVLFSKPNSAISTQLISFHQEQLHYEAEMCFLYEDGRFSAIGLGLDLTKRKLQRYLKENGLPWERAKSFDGSAVLSHFVEISNMPSQARFELRINGHLAQEGNIDLMIHKPQAILSEILSYMTLNDGDIVMTGTPEGVGEICKGDEFSAALFVDSSTILEKTWIAN
jgi:2-keto-4-pentenoate hydratase/2-oxohepta-3-ene-1,7-dioic acid hydratase in catechol pathway